VGERGPVVDDTGVCLLAQRDQVLARAVEGVAVRMELEPLQDAVQLLDMPRIFRADEKVKVDEAGLGGDVEAQFDVRENELDAGQAARCLVP
jgi:hypothetical protein